MHGHIDIVFDGPPGPEGARLVEIENPGGRSIKFGEWIERRTGRVVSNKKQGGWEYLKRLRQSPKVPRPHHEKANNGEQEAFKKGSR